MAVNYSLIILVFVLAGVVMAVWSWRKIQNKKQTLDWPEIKAKVVSSKIDQNLTPDIEYEFELNGKQVQKKYEFTEGMTASPEYAQRVVEQHPVGSQLTVYYDPKNPDHIIMSRGPDKEDKISLAIGVAMVVFGGFLLLINL
ncbi:MAG: DUF3592 domain-containing protein, partial [Gammaproteobacteria bacterium]|nr:DUF3592 domain-containing protein [Gammaproteobacteria bacterium]MDH5692256.1 DUF3592 domain-containing protein [Gammaproteobacteria bacterium]